MLAPCSPHLRNSLALIIVAAICSSLSSASAKDAASSATATHRILSCNIRKPLESDVAEGNGWEDRRQLCGDVIAAHDGDVICLQEARPYQVAYLKQRLPELDSYGLSNPSPEFTPNNAILFSRERYELISAGGFWLSETPHVAGSNSWDSAVPRHTTWVHLRERQTGRELRVWNTHLDHKGHVAREAGARLLVEAVAAMDATGVPQVLVGDMNAPADHPAIRVLKAGGFTDTYETVHGPADPGRTHHAFLGLEHAERYPEKHPGRRIDWIFTRGDVQTHAAKIIRDGRDGRYPSDHYFISADVSLPE